MDGNSQKTELSLKVFVGSLGVLSGSKLNNIMTCSCSTYCKWTKFTYTISCSSEISITYMFI